MLIVATGASFLAASVLLLLVPSILARPPRGALVAVGLAAAAGTLVAEAAPTGTPAVDAACRVALGLVLVAAGAGAGRVPVALAAAGVAATLLVAESPVAGLAGAALGLAAAGLAAPARTPLLGAAVGGLLAQVVLRLDGPTPTGASLLLGAAVTAVVVVPALVRLPGRARRPVAWATGVVAAVVVVGTAGAGVAAVSVADDVEVAVADAERGLDLVADDPVAARATLAGAADRFDTARDRLGAPWVRPALAVPVLAQQVRAVTTMAEAGRDLAEVAATSLAEADVDAVRPVGGRFDLEAVRALQAPLDRAERALARTGARLEGARSPWLVRPVAERLDELADRLEDAGGSAELAAMAVDALPGMLGGDGPRRYLLLVQQPAESRGSGGLPGNYGELVAEDGRVSLTTFGRHGELTDGGVPLAARTVEMTPTYDALYGYGAHLRHKWANVTFAPDFGVVAELVRQLYPQSGGQAIDGVIAVDPSAVADLLAVVGGVELSDGRTLDAGNAEAFLYFEQYVDYDDEDAPHEGYSERIDLLGEAAARTWARLVEGDLPGPRALVRTFDPSVAGRHLQMVAFDPVAQRLLQRVGLDGSLPEPTGDGVGVVLQNVGENKIDWFLDRATAYDVRWDPATGVVEGTYRVTLTNRAPSEGLPRYVIGPYLTEEEDGFTTVAGDNASIVYLYTALPPVAVRADGLEEQRQVQRDGAWYVTPLRVKTPAGATSVIEVDVAGPLDADRWHLDVLRQPTIHGEVLDIALAVAEGWDVTGAGSFHREGPGRVAASLTLDEPVAVSVRAVPVGAGGGEAASGD